MKKEPPEKVSREVISFHVNELNSRPGVSYTYDYNGNTQRMVNSSGTTTYSWDFENRLVSTGLPGSGGTVYFRYDPFGGRISKISSSGTSVYVYDGDNLVEETNSSGAVVGRYSQGLNIDELLAMLRSGSTSYYEADGLGSLTSLSNTAGTVTFSGQLGAYGTTVIVDNGNGTTTLYGHNLENSVKEGDYVEQGEVIGTVGQSGNAKGQPESEAHVHFEVRENGRRVDPAVWLNLPVEF